MPYIGNTPAEKYAAFNVQHFTTSATTSYTLTHAVANELDIRLVLNNVVQQPGASYAYTASATTLTLSVATTGTDTMYAVYIGKAVQTVTPGADSVGPTALQDNSVTEAKLNVSNSPTNGYVLSAQSGATGGLTWAADAAGTITAFTNGVDNRVVTATSATALNGEANLNFDGSKLGIGTSTMTRTLNVTDTTASASTGIQLIGANDGTQFLNFGDTDDTNVGEINYDHSTNKMNFRTNDAYAMVIDSAGTVTKPLQPCFLVRPSTDQASLPTGDTTVAWGAEIFDVGSNFASNTFTAPVTGKYQFNVSLYLSFVDIDTTLFELYMVASNRTQRLMAMNMAKDFSADSNSFQSMNASTILDMDASDTIYGFISVTGGGGVIRLNGGAPSSEFYTSWSGALIC